MLIHDPRGEIKNQEESTLVTANPNNTIMNCVSKNSYHLVSVFRNNNWTTSRYVGKDWKISHIVKELFSLGAARNKYILRMSFAEVKRSMELFLKTV